MRNSTYAAFSYCLALGSCCDSFIVFSITIPGSIDVTAAVKALIVAIGILAIV